MKTFKRTFFNRSALLEEADEVGEVEDFVFGGEDGLIGNIGLGEDGSGRSALAM